MDFWTLFSIKKIGLGIVGTLMVLNVVGSFMGVLYDIEAEMPDNYHLNVRGRFTNTNPVGIHNMRISYYVTAWNGVTDSYVGQGTIYVGDIARGQTVEIRDQIAFNTYVDASKDYPRLNGAIEGYFGPIPFLIPIDDRLVEVMIKLTGG